MIFKNKPKIFFFIFIELIVILISYDTIYTNPFPIGGPGSAPYIINNKFISLDYERILITDDYEKIIISKDNKKNNPESTIDNLPFKTIQFNCTYILKNLSSSDQNVTICLPTVLNNFETDLIDVKIYENSELLKVEKVQIAGDTDADILKKIQAATSDEFPWVSQLFVYKFDTRFKPNELKEIKLTYDSIKGLEPPSTYGTYILRTANFWTNKIKKCEIIFDPKLLKNANLKIDKNTISKYYTFNYNKYNIKDNKLVFEFYNFTAKKDFKFFCNYDSINLNPSSLKQYNLDKKNFFLADEFEYLKKLLKK